MARHSDNAMARHGAGLQDPALTSCNSASNSGRAHVRHDKQSGTLPASNGLCMSQDCPSNGKPALFYSGLDHIDVDMHDILRPVTELASSKAAGAAPEQGIEDMQLDFICREV